jgi:hypothetical protein
MAHAYTPGLTVTRMATLRRERRLPILGQVLAKQGERIPADKVVARTELPGNVQTVNVANLLGVPPEDVARSMVKREGEAIAKGEIIAQTKSFFGLFTSKVAAPVAGSVETISQVTGNVILREPPIPLDVNGYVSGEVVEVLPGQGVVVETRGAFVQGIFGIGGETHGKLVMAVARPEDELDQAALARQGDAARGAILVGGSQIHRDTLRAAVAAGVRGVVVGGFSDRDLRDFLGYDLGVAITGHEEMGITLMVTEGFGRMPMAKRTFDLLSALAGQEASMNGATQIRAGVQRPELIVPSAPGAARDEQAQVHTGGMEIGTPIRIIREPYFGRLGTVSELPSELQPLETEARVRVVEVDLGGERVVLPRANVEMIEG